MTERSRNMEAMADAANQSPMSAVPRVNHICCDDTCVGTSLECGSSPRAIMFAATGARL